MMNPCLRPASLSDMPPRMIKVEWHSDRDELQRYYLWATERVLAIVDLYDAEWRLRGFERSP